MLTATEKAEVVMAMLASGKDNPYRVWFWSNYPRCKQSALKLRWANAIGRYDIADIRNGMERWKQEMGRDNPPDPFVFAEYIKPQRTQAHEQAVNDLRKMLRAG